MLEGAAAVAGVALTVIKVFCVAGALAAALSVNVETPPGKTLAGLNDADSPAGKPLALRAISNDGSVNPDAVTVTS